MNALRALVIYYEDFESFLIAAFGVPAKPPKKRAIGFVGLEVLSEKPNKKWGKCYGPFFWRFCRGGSTSFSKSYRRPCNKWLVHKVAQVRVLRLFAIAFCPCQRPFGVDFFE